MVYDSLSILFQLAIHPPVFLVRDEQDDDVSLVKAEQCIVAAGSVGKDGAHTRPLHDVVEACGDGHRPGEAAVLTACVVWADRSRPVREGHQHG